MINQILSEDRRNEWVMKVAGNIADELIIRHDTGRKSHGGYDLGTVPSHMLLSEIEREAMDILIYMRELRRRKTLSNE